MPEIKLLLPDLPCVDELLPWLRRIDAARWYTNFGPLARELEQTLASHWSDAGAVHAVGLSSGTAALELGLAALGLAAGGTVLLPSFTFPATAAAVLRCGLRPLLSDVAPDNWQLTVPLARDAARRHQLALVMPVATFGCPVDSAAWDAFSSETGIPVLIDAAAAFGNQAIGARCSAAFSLHATKPFGIGEGGAFATRDALLAQRVRRLSNFGFEDGLALDAGGNAKMSEYAAAVGLAQWPRWQGARSARAGRWAAYGAALAALPEVSLQQGYAAGQVPAQAVIRLPGAAAPVQAALAAAGIETRRWNYPPLHRHPAFARALRAGPGGGAELPVTEALAHGTLGLPWHAALTPGQCERVAAVLREALAPAGQAQGVCIEGGR